ncbi:MAG TPA: TetR/AcrR family transcriptional regulator [Bryobacteraceae bacterium]|jgi:AcrR family transcriptional regulator|nr:TetR/AcrR family transcriptional regulator [Bryobacteraceae bacterium]
MTDKGDTKSRILDAAEKLFGMNGFEATSLREITAEASVNLAAINYHFQTKDSLIDAIVARRIEPVNKRRLELLEAAGPNPALEKILTAFMAPVMQVRADTMVPLIGRILSNPDLFVDRVFLKHLAPVSQCFVEALSKALPDLPPSDVLWRLHFSVAVMTHTMLWGKVYPKITNGICDITDRDALVDRAVRFVAAGFRAPASQESD